MCRSMEGCICVQAGVLALTRFDCHQLINYQPNKSLNAVPQGIKLMSASVRACVSAVRQCLATLHKPPCLLKGSWGPLLVPLRTPWRDCI